MKSGARVLLFSLIGVRNCRIQPRLFAHACRLLLEKLLKARRTFEGAEPGGPLEPLLPQAPEPAPAPRSRDRGRRTDEAAEEKVERSPALAIRLVHLLRRRAGRRLRSLSSVEPTLMGRLCRENLNFW